MALPTEEQVEKFSGPRAQLNYLCQAWFPGDLPDARTVVNTVLAREPAEFLQQLDALAQTMSTASSDSRSHRKKLPEPLLKMLAQGSPEPLPLYPVATLRHATSLTQSILLNDQVYYWSIDLPDAAHRLLKQFRRLAETVLAERELGDVHDSPDPPAWRAPPPRRSPLSRFMALFACSAQNAGPADRLRLHLLKLDKAWAAFERRYYRELSEFSERALLPLALAVNMAQKLRPIDPLLVPRAQAAQTLAVRLQRQPFPVSGAAARNSAVATPAPSDAVVKSRLRSLRVRLFRMLQRVAFMMSTSGRSDLDPTPLKEDVLLQAEEWLHEHGHSRDGGGDASRGTSDFASPMRVLLEDVCKGYAQLVEVLLRRGALPWGQTSPWLVENEDLVDAFAALIRACRVAAKYTQCTRLQLLATVTGVLTHLVQDDVHHLLRGSHAALPAATESPDVTVATPATTVPGGSPGGQSNGTRGSGLDDSSTAAEVSSVLETGSGTSTTAVDQAVREAVAAACSGEEALEALVAADAAARIAAAARAEGPGHSELLERVACFDPTVLLNLPGVLLAFAVVRHDRACENVCRVLYRDLIVDRDYVRARQHAVEEPLDEAAFSTLLADLLSDEPLADAEGHALGEGTHAHAGEDPSKTVLACLRRCMLRLQRSRPGDWNELEQVAIFCLLHSDLAALLKAPDPTPFPAPSADALQP